MFGSFYSESLIGKTLMLMDVSQTRLVFNQNYKDLRSLSAGPECPQFSQEPGAKEGAVPMKPPY